MFRFSAAGDIVKTVMQLQGEIRYIQSCAHRYIGGNGCFTEMPTIEHDKVVDG